MPDNPESPKQSLTQEIAAIEGDLGLTNPEAREEMQQKLLKLKGEDLDQYIQDRTRGFSGKRGKTARRYLRSQASRLGMEEESKKYKKL